MTPHTIVLVCRYIKGFLSWLFSCAGSLEDGETLRTEYLILLDEMEKNAKKLQSEPLLAICMLFRCILVGVYHFQVNL